MEQQQQHPIQQHDATAGSSGATVAEEVRGSEDSTRLVGVPLAVARDAVMAEREEAAGVPNLQVGVVDGGVQPTKRKRGRPAKNDPRIPAAPPPVRQQEEEDEEDVCFICFDGGSLVLCDRRGCPKAYHPACIKRDEAFFRSKAKWNCGWHICSFCQKSAHFMCYTCTYSVCKGCTQYADFVCVRGNKGLCGICMRTIMLIENSVQGNKEMCEVDFDDKSSWEYLFKVYWVLLKGKLSLTFDELLQARHPWNGVSPLSSKLEAPRELQSLKDDKGSGSDNSCIDVESNNLRNKKSMRQQKLLTKGDCFGQISSAGDHSGSVPESSKWASKDLLEFVAHMKNGETSLLSQFDVQNLLLEYVKKNNLRDPQQKCQIVCDHRLMKLFGKSHVGHIEMLKLLESHFFIKDNGPAEDTLKTRIIDAFSSEANIIDNHNIQMTLVSDKKIKILPQNNPDAYAAINAHNINLIYLRRSLLENLTEDAEKIRDKVVGSFVRIKISSSDKKQEMYRLVQVVGTSKAAEPYKIGTRTTDIVLEILNLNRKELIPIDEISNHEFSEDECKRLRQSIKYGLSKRLTVGEIMDKAFTFQAMRVNDLMEAEILRLNHLRDRASEKGHRKELRECVEKLQILNSPEERQRRLQEIPEVHSDPNLDLMFESDEDVGKSDERKQDGNIWSKYPAFDRRERDEASLPRSCNSVLNDDGYKAKALTAVCESNGNVGMAKTHINPNNNTSMDDSTSVVVKSEASDVALNISSSLQSTVMDKSFNEFLNDKSWHYQDPSGKVQGPFSMLHLYKWNASGHFPPDLRVWRINEKQGNSVLLIDALGGKYLKNVSLSNDSQLLSLGSSVTLDNKDNSQDGGSNGTRSETHEDNQVTGQSREQKVDDTCTTFDGRDKSVKSNGWHDQSHAYPSQPSMGFFEKLKEMSFDKLKEGHQIEGNPADNVNDGSKRTAEGQSNSRQSYQKQSYSKENSGQSSEQNWRGPHVNTSSNCAVTTSAEVSTMNTSPLKLGFDLHSTPNCVVTTSAEVSMMKASPLKLGFDLDSSSNCVVTTSAELSMAKTSPLKLGFDLHSHPSQAACTTSSWQTIIGEPTDFSTIADVDESVSDLLAEVEAMESLGGGSLESPTSIMKCGGELTESSKNDCLSFVDGLSPVLDAGKGDASSSTGDLHLQPQSTTAEEPLRQTDTHRHHQRTSGGLISRSSEVKVGTKNIGVSGYQWESGSENSAIGPSAATWGIATDTTWRPRSENTNLAWVGMDRGNVNIGWGVGQSAVQENRSTNSYNPAVSPSFSGSHPRYGSDRFSMPRDQAFHGHGRESGSGRGRNPWSKQPAFGFGNGGSHRPPPKGQRVCKFYESGHCKKGASCGYYHP